MSDELKRWSDMSDDPDAICACAERWKAVAEIIGCTVIGFNDDYSASFRSPDGGSFNVGPKLREAILNTRAELGDILALEAQLEKAQESYVAITIANLKERNDDSAL